MPSTMVEFPANGRTTPGYLATPAGGKGPGLILIQEYWGLVDHIKRVADRFASAGFVTLAPDLYHGKTTKSPDEAGKLLMALNIAEAAKDMRGAAEFLLQNDAVTSERVGILGFCMGGQLALYAGTEYPDKFAAVVDFYGVHPNVQVDAAKLRVPVLAHFAKRDTHTAESDARAFVQRVQGAEKEIEAHFYDADHAFFNDTRPEVYDKESAELAWERSLEFLREHVR